MGDQLPTSLISLINNSVAVVVDRTGGQLLVVLPRLCAVLLAHLPLQPSLASALSTVLDHFSINSRLHLSIETIAALLDDDVHRHREGVCNYIPPHRVLLQTLNELLCSSVRECGSLCDVAELVRLETRVCRRAFTNPDLGSLRLLIAFLLLNDERIPLPVQVSLLLSIPQFPPPPFADCRSGVFTLAG